MAVTVAERDTGSSSLIVREATSADDAQICAQMLRTAMPGQISLATSHDPSFFASIQVEGHDPRVVVAERDGQILGVGLIAARRVYLNGEPAEIGYISSLRTDPSIRSTTAMGRGNRLFKQLHDTHFHLPFYLGCILKDNIAAQRMFASGRAGLPESLEIGTLYTAAIPLTRRVRPRLPGGIEILRGSSAGPEAIIECLNRFGREKQFYPVYTVEDLLSEDGLLRGLGIDDFRVAVSGGRIVGLMACWDQLAYRRTVVAGYEGALRLAKPLLSPLARMLRLAPLPGPGDAIRSFTAACIAIEENDTGVFRALLHSILRDHHNTARTFLMVGLMEQDPLLPVARHYVHFPTRSTVYALQWGGVETTMDGRVPYLELGSL